jgi:uncharacterized phage protein gp47/JayE
MPVVPLTDLVKVATKDEVLSTLIKLLKLGSFPITAWQPGTVMREFVEKVALLGADWSRMTSLLAKGGLLELAEREWLTMFARSAYGLVRNVAIYTVGTMTLTDTGGAPVSFSPGDIIVVSNDGKRFVNTTGGTLNAASTLSLTFKAETAGASYNVSDATVSTFVTSFPGVAVSNPSIGTSPWFTTSGTDEESDESLRERCRARWGAIGSGGNRDAYIYWARTASAQVTRVSVQEHYPTDGKVGVFIAGASGPLPATVQATVNTYVQARKPLTTTVAVNGVTAITVTLTGTITYRSTMTLATVQANVATKLAELQRLKGIGEDVYRAEIFETIMSADGVVNVPTLTTPAADFPVGIPEVAAFNDVTAVGVFTWTAV